jgi:hypothetical protein
VRKADQLISFTLGRLLLRKEKMPALILKILILGRKKVSVLDGKNTGQKIMVKMDWLY